MAPDAMASMSAALDALAGADVCDTSDAALGEELIALSRAAARVQAQLLRRLEVFDRRGGAGHFGAVSTAAWLRGSARLGPGAARTAVVVARRLADDLPATAAGMASGELSYDSAREIVRAVEDLPAEHIGSADTKLAAAGRSLTSSQLRQVGMRLRHVLDVEGSKDAAVRAYERRELYVSATFDGRVAVDGMLDPQGGETLLAALHALSGPIAGDARTPGQRRADALVELCRRALDAAILPEAGGERPHVTVTLELASLQATAGAPGGKLGWAGPVCGETARRIACDASVTRVITDGPSEVLDVGRKTRVVPAGMRRALRILDGGCRWPDCDRPDPWCDAHHVIFWANGGPTSLPNLVLLCGAHHRYVHERGWILRLDPDRHVTVTPPERPPPRAV